MNRDQLPFYAIAAAVLVVGLIFAGVSPFLLILLACPLMMIFMMRGMDHGGTHDNHGDSPSKRDESTGRHHP